MPYTIQQFILLILCIDTKNYICYNFYVLSVRVQVQSSSWRGVIKMITISLLLSVCFFLLSGFGSRPAEKALACTLGMLYMGQALCMMAPRYYVPTWPGVVVIGCGLVVLAIAAVMIVQEQRERSKSRDHDSPDS